MENMPGETISKLVAGLGFSVALASLIYDNFLTPPIPPSSSAYPQSKPTETPPSSLEITCVVKLGGSACTNKDVLETFNPASVSSTASQLIQSEIVPLLIHGAGSFGHFQAREFSVSQGGALTPRLREGFARTRVSVLKLNSLIVDRLVQSGLAAVGLSPGGHLRTAGRAIQPHLANSFIDQVANFVKSGFIPVVHGDACLDEKINCTILSGDALFVWFCRIFRPKYGVFLTDVAGVFTKPPSEPDAQLLPSIKVDCKGQRLGVQVAFDTRKHDVTGGIQAKLNVACHVAGELGIPVYIVQVGSSSAAQALKGLRPDLGTTVERV